MKGPLIIDCDPGVDDAIALLLTLAPAHSFDLLGVTTVAGNVPLSLTHSNARKICALAGKPETPVYAGCPRPLLRPLATAEEVHGATGLQGADLPEPSGEVPSQHAVDFLRSQLLGASEPITVVVLGPMTNLAVALVQSPEIAKNIKQLVIMGGARGSGNITPSAEFNIYVDPHAAQVVLSAGIPTVLIPLDTTHQVLTTAERLERIRRIGNPVAEAAAGMLAFYGESDRENYDLPDGPLHDPCTIAYLLKPELFTTKQVPVTVELTGEQTIGRTVMDWHSKEPSNIQVTDRVDADGFYELLINALASYS